MCAIHNIAERRYAELAISYLISYDGKEGKKAEMERHKEQARKLKLNILTSENPFILWSEIAPIDILKQPNVTIKSLDDYFYGHILI